MKKIYIETGESALIYDDATEQEIELLKNDLRCTRDRFNKLEQKRQDIKWLTEHGIPSPNSEMEFFNNVQMLSSNSALAVCLMTTDSKDYIINDIIYHKCKIVTQPMNVDDYLGATYDETYNTLPVNLEFREAISKIYCQLYIFVQDKEEADFTEKFLKNYFIENNYKLPNNCIEQDYYMVDIHNLVQYFFEHYYSYKEMENSTTF